MQTVWLKGGKPTSKKFRGLVDMVVKTHAAAEKFREVLLVYFRNQYKIAVRAAKNCKQGQRGDEDLPMNKDNMQNESTYKPQTIQDKLFIHKISKYNVPTAS